MSYDHIVLTEQEREEALFQARKAKHYLQEKQRYLETITKTAHPVFENSKQYYDYVIQTSGLDVDKDNESVLKILISYFYGEVNTYTKEVDLNKGIMLFGNVGVGKTETMKAFRSNPRASFVVADSLNLVNDYASEGVGVIEEYARLIPNPNRLQKYFGNQFLGVFFDDLGTEVTGVNFGNKKNVMGEILFLRYSNCRGPYTHVTTNNTIAEFRELYGIRVVDRMREMFNLIEFPEGAKSRRR
jgi:DNA replication protein DnaC